MTPKGKKALLVIGSIVAIGGVVGYILWKRKKDKDAQTSTGTGTDTGTGTQPDVPLMSSSYTTSGGGGGGSQFTFPFTTTEEGNKFRAWVIAKDPAFAKSISLDATGKLNSFVQKAWDKYGAEYQKATTTTTTTTPTKAERDALWVKSYTDARKVGAPTFTFEGKVYDSQTLQLWKDPSKFNVGDEVWVKNPIPSSVRTKNNGLSGYNGAGLITAYQSGGISFGNLYANYSAGTILEVNNTLGSVKVKNAKRPMISSSGSYTSEYWLPLAGLTKTKPAMSYSFNGMTEVVLG